MYIPRRPGATTAWHQARIGVENGGIRSIGDGAKNVFFLRCWLCQHLQRLIAMARKNYLIEGLFCLLTGLRIFAADGDRAIIMANDFLNGGVECECDRQNL